MLVVGSPSRDDDDSFADTVGGLEVLVGCSDLAESGVGVGDDDVDRAGFDGVELLAQGVSWEVGCFACVAGEVDAVGDRER